jgi:hypothetical protein
LEIQRLLLRWLLGEAPAHNHGQRGLGWRLLEQLLELKQLLLLELLLLELLLLLLVEHGGSPPCVAFAAEHRAASLPHPRTPQ